MRGHLGAAASAVLMLAAAPAAAQEPVDLELALAADGSGSIDDAELALQRQGYAAAITHPRVIDAILSGIHGRIAVTYIEWGGAGSQHVIVDWAVISDEASARAFAEALVAAPRQAMGYNSISNAITFAALRIESNAYEGFRKVIDVSADAGQRGGRPLPVARAEALAAGMTINGLAIALRGSGRPGGAADLEGHFARDIIGGPGAFVITADAETSFAEAVLSKLLLEIAGPATPAEVPVRTAAR